MKHSLKIFLILLLSLSAQTVFAQFGEPPVKKKDNPRNLYDEGFRKGIGVNVSLNDFGFTISAQYRRVLKPYQELIINAGIGGLRDPSEQTFIDYTFGFRTIPDKFQRVVNIPIFIGLKNRVFADAVQDNFRIFYAASAGPVFAISVPYFNDTNDNGFREDNREIFGFTEQINDIFTGWNDAESHLGFGGEFMLGVDFGENFANITSVQFGYTFRYFNGGIQILEPFQADLDQRGFPQDQDNNGVIDRVPFKDKKKFFGSAQITFVFGIMK